MVALTFVCEGNEYFVVHFFYREYTILNENSKSKKSKKMFALQESKN